MRCAARRARIPFWNSVRAIREFGGLQPMPDGRHDPRSRQGPGRSRPRTQAGSHASRTTGTGDGWLRSGGAQPREWRGGITALPGFIHASVGHHLRGSQATASRSRQSSRGCSLPSTNEKGETRGPSGLASEAQRALRSGAERMKRFSGQKDCHPQLIGVLRSLSLGYAPSPGQSRVPPCLPTCLQG